MAKNLIITLEYDMGDYLDMEEDGYEIPTDPKDVSLNESFYQSDALIHDMKIVGVRVENRKEPCSFCDRAFEHAYNYCPYCGGNMRR